MKPTRGRPSSLRRSGILLAASAAALLELTAAPAHAVIFHVGVGTGCTHATVELAIAAAAANGPDLDVIRIASPSMFLGSLVEINDHSVIIEGGFPSCTAGSPTGRTALNRTGATDAFWVHGALSIQRIFALHEIDVVMGSSAGRALTLEDLLYAELSNSTLDGGQAVDGGNVWMSGAVDLWLMSGSQILNGHTTTGSGGGVFCRAGGTINIYDEASGVHNNASGVDGGGIYATDCDVFVASGGPPRSDPPFSGGGVFANSAARDGGGIYAVDGSTVSLTGDVHSQLGYVVSNHGDNLGGGVYLKFGASLDSQNGVIAGNSAGTGGGIFALTGTTVLMDVDANTCGIGRGCSELSWNHADGGNSGAIYVASGASATIRQTRIKHNYTRFGSTSAVSYVAGSLLIEGAEIYDNVDTSMGDPEADRFLVGGAGTNLTIAYSTIVEETLAAGVGAFRVFDGSTFRLLSSIVQATKTFHAPPIATQVDCVITKETASFPGGGSAVTVVADSNLLFESPAADDFRIRRTSDATDYCDTVNYVPTDADLDNYPRGYDDPLVLNSFGPYDVGADEWRPEIFSDGFEIGSTLRWWDTSP